MVAVTASGRPVQWRRIWQLAGPEQTPMLRAMLFRLMQSFALGLGFAATLWAIRDLAAGREITQIWLWQLTGLAALSLAGQLGFSFLSVSDAWQASFRVCGTVRLALLDRLLALPLGYHFARERGDLVNLMSTDVDALGTFLSDGLGRVVQAFGLPLAILVFMAAIDVRLALAMALTIAVGVPVLAQTSHKLSGLGLLRQSQLAVTSARVGDFVIGQLVLRAFGRQAGGTARFRYAVDGLSAISVRLVRALVAPVMIFVAILMLGIPVTMLAIAWTLGSLEAGTVLTALILAYAIYAPIINLVSAMEMMRIAEASLLRMDAVFDQPVPSPASPTRSPQGFALSVDDVSFAYDGKTAVLRDLSFEVPERSMVAIVGPSGSGKSTLLNLIAHFWDPDTGTISIGGVPLPEDLDDDLDLARRRGVATIIDLRDDRARTALPLDDAAVRVGMDLVVVERNLPSDTIQDLTSEISNAAIDSVRDVLNRPGRDGVLLLDDDGSLSAAVYAIHLAADKGADPSDVLRGARGSGLSDRDADFVRSQVARSGG